MSKRNRAAYESDLNESSGYVFYGTPLPPLDPDVRDDGSFVPIWKQEVRDEKGRKRLHGAFTGGFSAGYFNTVGSKEGWTPATFKSSRTERAKIVQVRPEDFMDEEDLAQATEARRLEISGNFTGLGSTAEELARKSAITVMDLFKPAPEDTMGVKLLKKMGWKEGQGIGPKVKRKAVLGDEGEAEDVADQDLHYFAPKDTAVVKINRKNDRHGLDYTGKIRDVEQEEEMTEMRTIFLKPSESRSRGGFGVGILNDDEEEDEDIYEIKPKSAYSRVIGGDAKKTKKNANSNIVKAPMPAKHVFISKKTSFTKSGLNLRKCHDGRLPLEGFVLSLSTLQTQDEWYPPPEIPEDWIPSISQGQATSSESGNRPSLAQYAASSKLDSRARGLLLGEVPLPGKSVFDFMSASARERIAAATGRTDLPPALNEAPPSHARIPLGERVPKVDKSAAISALSGGFMPYADDLGKRARYRKFLEIQAGIREGLPDRIPDMSDTDWMNELNEFASCARIFKATPNMIASRFTSAASAVSYIPTSGGKISDDPDFLLHRPAPTVKEQSPAEQAAKLGMYGPMTRIVEEFWPTRLLCKRFNVRAPLHVESAVKNDEKGKGNPNDTSYNENLRITQQLLEHKADAVSAPPIISRPPAQPKELISTNEITQMIREIRGDDSFEIPSKEQLIENEINRVNVEVNEALEAEKAADDVFEAIFGNDSDQEDQ